MKPIEIKRLIFKLTSKAYNLQSNKVMEIASIPEATSPRLKRRNSNSDPQAPRNYLKELFTLILPPFMITIFCFLFAIVSTAVKFTLSFFKRHEESGESSQQFHKRRFQEQIQSLELEQDDLGFTNQVLVQEGRKTINFYLPVYVACKIKSIQDVSVQSLTGNISCALLIYIKYGDLPEEIVKRLESTIVLQLNRGDSLLLLDDGLTISCKRDQKTQFLVFTIRKVFLAFMIQDTLWSPFELLELIISITLNTVTIPQESLPISKERTGYNPKKEYKISFNCMRNSDLLPLSFALDCVYGVYDLAQRKLQSYHSRFSTYKEVQKNHQEYLEKSKKAGVKGQKKKEELKKKLQNRKSKTMAPSDNNNLNFFANIAEIAVRRLSMRMTTKDIKSPPKKVKYFQYTHLVIPLYKYPGNVIITIFLPVFLLALLSLAIFFQQPQLSGRIGSIATMILGYIALIPSIKEQLPPSAKLTVIQTLVYFETMCCMLCLYESFMIRNLSDYTLIWNENFAFLLCLTIHIGVFVFVFTVYALHKLKWEPSYNYDSKIAQIKPTECHMNWDNPYCDQVFVKYNQDVMKHETSRNKEERLIRPYTNPIQTSIGVIDPQFQGSQQKKSERVVSLSLFEDAPQRISKKQLPKVEPSKEEEERQYVCKILPMISPSRSEFVTPDEELYYKKQI